eukprot:52670-Eustigmatos_ZCMA.PRE.1
MVSVYICYPLALTEHMNMIMIDEAGHEQQMFHAGAYTAPRPKGEGGYQLYRCVLAMMFARHSSHVLFDDATLSGDSPGDY